MEDLCIDAVVSCWDRDRLSTTYHVSASLHEREIRDVHSSRRIFGQSSAEVVSQLKATEFIDQAGKARRTG
jgi:hypothetical protein